MIEPLLQAERLLTVGMLDQAEQHYERIAEQDPVNAIARTGLARVALERGDEVTAYRHARRAVELDPENGIALRLEARLSEVLGVRGEIVERPAEGLERRPAEGLERQPAAAAGESEPEPAGVRGSLRRLRRLLRR
jgi:tetratricopeptide (TPR) repeat protein